MIIRVSPLVTKKLAAVNRDTVHCTPQYDFSAVGTAVTLKCDMLDLNMVRSAELQGIIGAATATRIFPDYAVRIGSCRLKGDCICRR